MKSSYSAPGGTTPHLSQQAIASLIHASSSISRDHSATNGGTLQSDPAADGRTGGRMDRTDGQLMTNPRTKLKLGRYHNLFYTLRYQNCVRYLTLALPVKFVRAKTTDDIRKKRISRKIIKCMNELPPVSRNNVNKKWTIPSSILCTTPIPCGASTLRYRYPLTEL